MAKNKECLQERYAPNNHCFGCGPSNDQGLRIRSFAVDDSNAESEVVAEWRPQPHHEAFDDILSGGIIGTLLDCHSNWTAAFHLMRRDGLETPPCTVTARFSVSMKYPTPSKGAVTLSATVRESEGSRVTVDATLTAEGRVTATCEGVFVAVKPGHPAYRRW